MEKRGLGPWLIANKTASEKSLDDANEIEQVAKATASWLKRPEGNDPADPKWDTFFFYLRGNCVVYDDQAWFMRASFLADSIRNTPAKSPVESIPAAIELGKLLDWIAEAPARNIVILADVCDLISDPQLGLMVNPVPSMIEKICQNGRNRTDKNVWIMLLRQLCSIRTFPICGKKRSCKVPANTP